MQYRTDLIKEAETVIMIISLFITEMEQQMLMVQQEVVTHIRFLLLIIYQCIMLFRTLCTQEPSILNLKKIDEFNI